MAVMEKFNIDNKPVHLQKVLTVADKAFKLACIRSFDYDSEQDYKTWCEIVNAAYKENYVPESAKKTLLKHPFLQSTETYFYLDKEGTPVGTISIGAYKDNPNIAGDFRLAVNPDCQNMGIGGGVNLVC